jgi:hypothetical protein
LKLIAVFSWNMLFGIETIRKSCGGNGFSYYSGIPSIRNEMSPIPTYEGENTILLLQTARFLVRAYDGALKG